MVWFAETATKAYLETVKTVTTLIPPLNPGGFPFRGFIDESSVAELVSAMAAGSNAQLIVEAWSRDAGMMTSVGLGIARRHTLGRHVCVVPDERSRSEYLHGMRCAGFAPEVFVGEADKVMGGFSGVDFAVVDCRRTDCGGVLRFARLSRVSAVLVCMEAGMKAGLGSRCRGVIVGTTRVVRSAFLPLGNGLEIWEVAGIGSLKSNKSRWISQIDRRTGEEHVFLR